MERREAKQRALEFIQRKQSPVLIGELCLYLGPYCTLKEAEGILTELAEENQVRRLTPDELGRLDLRLAYVSV